MSRGSPDEEFRRHERLVERNLAKMIPPTFPSLEQLQPLLEKVESHPGSVILVAIEPAEPCCNFCRVTFAWLPAEDRNASRRALEACRRKRQKVAEKGWTPTPDGGVSLFP